MREARQLEQSHNPNYLKSSSVAATSAQSNAINDGCEDIPIAELSLDVPLQITCKCWAVFGAFLFA